MRRTQRKTQFNAARFDELEYDLTTLAERCSQEATRDDAHERLPVSDCLYGEGWCFRLSSETVKKPGWRGQ
jgi:hypothetical protein